MFRNVAALRSKRLVTLVIVFVAGLNVMLAADGSKREFDVRAGDAAETLRQFAKQANREIMFSAKLVAGVRTHAVKGTFVPREALERMLSDTRLTVVEHAKTGALVIMRLARPPQSQPREADRQSATAISK